MTDPVQEIQQQDFDEVEKILLDQGFLMYLKGRPYPMKGVPSLKAITAVNEIKRLLMQGEWNTNKMYSLLNPYLLPLKHMTNTACAVYSITLSIGGAKVAAIASHIIEYDGAYRFRLMDLCQETDAATLSLNPIRELWRLVGIQGTRDYPEVHKKIQRAAFVLTVLLMWPPFRKKFKRAVRRIEFSKLQFDEIDAYWTTQKHDYDYFGNKRH